MTSNYAQCIGVLRKKLKAIIRFGFMITGKIKVSVILGEPGAVSRAGRKGATKVFKNSPWVPTLTGPFLNGQTIAGS